MGIWNLGSNKESKREAKYQDALDSSLNPTFAVRLKKNKGEDSSTFTDIDVSSYTAIEIDFYFKSIQLDGDGFYLEAATDGSGSYNEIQYFHEGVAFFDDESAWYHEAIELDISEVQNIRIRFRCAGGDKKSEVNIAHVTLSGQNGLPGPEGSIVV